MALGYGGFTKAEAEEEGKEENKTRITAKAMMIGKPIEAPTVLTDLTELSISTVIPAKLAIWLCVNQQ